MAIVKRQEFAEMCSIEDNKLRSYISRKKVVTCTEAGTLSEGDKFIDTDHPINKAFKQQRKAKANLKKETAELVQRIAVSGPAPKFTIKAAPRENPETSEDEFTADDNELPEPLDENLINAYLLEKRGKNTHGADDGEGAAHWILVELKGRAKLVTLKAEREKLMVEKAAGRLLPVDLVTNVHKGYHKHVYSHMESMAEMMASKYCEILAGGDQSLYARVLDEVREGMEKIIKEGGAAATEDIKRIILNFSQSRNLVN